MGALTPLVVVGLLFFVASCSAVLFNGNSVTPSHNPTVDEYHSSGNVDTKFYYERNLSKHIGPGIAVGILLFICTSTYFTYRWCYACFCCCFRGCKKRPSYYYFQHDGEKGGHHDDDDEDAIVKADTVRSGEEEDHDYEKKRVTMLTHPVVSAVCRVFLLLILITVGLLMAIGLGASHEFHENLVVTLQTVDNTAVGINTTIHDTVYLLDNLVGVNGVRFPNDTAGLIENGNKIAEQANKIHSKGPAIDTIRDASTVAVYFLVAIPVLMGLVAVLCAKGRFAYIMSAMLPFSMLIIWLLFSFHYAVFMVNVDSCYAIDGFLTSTDYNTTEDNPLDFIFKCSSVNSVSPVIDVINNAANQTYLAMNNATLSPALHEQLTTQFGHLISAREDMQGLQGCSALANLMFNVYSDLCGKSVLAGLFLWQSQVALGTMLAITFLLGLMAEFKIGSTKSKDAGYNPLLSLNEE